MTQATPLGGGYNYYAYDSQNKRVWAWDGNTDSNGNASTYKVYFYGIDGKRLAAYQVTLMYNPTPYLSAATISQETYFSPRRIAPMDRLGSTNGKFYPYGENKPGNPANDTWKFATYFRDSATSLDYADQRYYANNLGRFTSPDPYIASGGPADPANWNRYA